MALDEALHAESGFGVLWRWTQTAVHAFVAVLDVIYCGILVVMAMWLWIWPPAGFEDELDLSKTQMAALLLLCMAVMRFPKRKKRQKHELEASQSETSENTTVR